MWSRIGFFHFAENYHDPLDSLGSALLEHPDVRDILIVLPEAFNNGRSYDDQPRMRPRFSWSETVDELSRLGEASGVAFVAGLLAPPLSSSYYVDRLGGRLVRHKMCDDYVGHYVPCATGCDFNNPFEVVGGLICNDIERHAQRMTAALGNRDGVRRVVCVPACMGEQWFGTGPLTAEYWLGSYVIVANSNAYGCGGFISNTRGERAIFMGQQNKIVLKSWQELDGE
jgi:hypothetical protein